MRKSTRLWILAFHVFVSFLTVSHRVQIVADDVGNPEGISIDCGVTQASCDENKFCYEANDGNVVESGQIYGVTSEYALHSKDDQVWQELNTLRSFPEGKRDCYTLRPKQGKNNNYLIRAYYMYGNYDNKNSVPDFEFHLGVNFWGVSGILGAGYFVRTKVIHVSPTNNIDVCLINTGHGIPFISLLQLWPLNNSIYLTDSDSDSDSLPLYLVSRSSPGTKANYGFIRYPDDIYARSWFLRRTIENSEPINASVAVDGGDMTHYKLPKEVLGPAIRSRNGSSSLVIDLRNYTSTEYEYYVYLHFFDFEEHSQYQQERWKLVSRIRSKTPLTLEYQVLKTMVKKIPQGEHLNNISITSTPDSGLPPIINSFEAYGVLPQPNSPTQEGDVPAMRNVKHAYNITRNWQGDPCRPSKYSWEDLTCNDLDNIPRITSFWNFSSSKLTGEINTSFSDLISLESLDLSNNQLMGEIPEVLAKLPSLKLLNLSGNNLTGSIPKALMEKNGTSLILSLDGNPSLCQIGCKTKTKKRIIAIIASVVASVAVLVIAVCITVKFCKHKRKNQSDKEGIPILSITNYFETVIGEEGFGKVYLGTLQDETQVAVKLLSKSSQQGFKEFQSEAELLMVVHHRNLVSLVGYCNDGDTNALVYEYMPEGNLRQKLSDKNPCPLKWNERLQIALDAACGVFNSCGNQNKKSDVYSFGIILLKLISGWPIVIGPPGDKNHISDWVAPKLERGDIQSIMDPRLEGKFNTASAWKFFEIAMSCIPPVAIQRPDIGHVVADLKECLALEISFQSAKSNSGISGSPLSINYFPLESNSAPCAR